jgi:hypothetical protein
VHVNLSCCSPVVTLIIVDIFQLCLDALSHHVALAAAALLVVLVLTKVAQAILAKVELRRVVEAALLLRLLGSVIAILRAAAAAEGTHENNN